MKPETIPGIILAALIIAVTMTAYHSGKRVGFEDGLRRGEHVGYSKYLSELRALVDTNNECQTARWNVMEDSVNGAIRAFIRMDTK